MDSVDPRRPVVAGSDAVEPEADDDTTDDRTALAAAVASFLADAPEASEDEEE